MVLFVTPELLSCTMHLLSSLLIFSNQCRAVEYCVLVPIFLLLKVHQWFVANTGFL